MPIRIECPHCLKKIKAPSKFAGKKANCPGCKAEILIPSLEASIAAKPSASKAIDDLLSGTPPAPPPLPTDFGSKFAESSLSSRPPIPPVDFDSAKPETKNGKPDGRRLHLRRIAVAVLALIGMSGSFLPWLHAPIVGTLNGIAGPDGKVTLGLFAASLVLALVGGSDPLSFVSRIFCTIPALAASGIAGYKLLNFDSHFESNSGSQLADGLARAISPGIGLFVIAAAGIAILVVPLFIPSGAKE